MKQTTSKERAAAALIVIKRHFSECTSKTPDNDWADLLALHYVAWGQLEPVLNFKQRATLVKVSQILKDLEGDQETSSWLRIEVRKLHKKLDELAQTQTLHGKQNTSDYRNKLALIGGCRNVWESYKGKLPPITFQGETHKFTQFVGDVIQEVFNYEFSPRSAIEAYDKRK